MSDIASIKQKIQLEATRFRSAVSESWGQAVGGSINWLIDNKKLIVNTYTVNTPFVVPSGITNMLIFGCGGGGGGGGGAGNSNAAGLGSAGGAGGNGALCGLTLLTVTPGNTLSIFIGAGGASGAGGLGVSSGSGGGTGGDSYVLDGVTEIIRFSGATGGGPGQWGTGAWVGNQPYIAGTASARAFAGFATSLGGASQSPFPFSNPGRTGLVGERSLYAAGGGAGAGGTSGAGGASGGGGGGASIGAGGAGGGGGNTDGNGVNGSTGGYGAGGGGGGGAGETTITNTQGGSGGAGGQGIIYLAYVPV